DLADQILGNRYGYRRPPGGFFLWLDVSQHGGSEGAAVKLWKEAGLRVVPGNYAARPQADGSNPGEGYIRVAMVQDRETTAEALLAVAGTVAAALATWSVQDPSLSHATNAPVRNMLGLPGAIGADLMMQLLGIATIALLFPVAAWGWRLLTHRPFDRERVRLVLWVIGAVAAAGFASCLPPSKSWPLPTGLGGVIGDAMLRAPAWVFGAPLS